MKRSLVIIYLIIGSIHALYAINGYAEPIEAVTIQPHSVPELDDRLPSDLSTEDTNIKSTLDTLNQREYEKSLETHQSDNEAIELQLEDTDLESFIKQIELLFDVTFIPDDIVIPLLTGKRPIKGNKITFRSNKVMTKTEVWSFFTTALDIAGLAIVPMGKPKFFRITKTEDARKSTIPAYIGVSPDTLPNDDQMIRYVYFVQEGSLATIKMVVEALRSNTSAFLLLNDLNAFVLTDKAYNIKTLMKIIQEFDRVTVPETMSVLKLRQADAADVKALYDAINQPDQKGAANKLFPARKQPTTLYFPENVRMIVDARLNTLIILGPQDAVHKVETFITEHLDRELDKPYAPLRTYTLKFADATTIANIMNQLVQFGTNTPVGRAGGVRGSDKYLRPMTFTPEPSTNQLIIRGSEEDFILVKPILEQLDEQQPQIGIEVLILSVTTIENKEMGTQLRSKANDLGTDDKDYGLNNFLGNNVKFQTSGITLGPANTTRGIQINPTGVGITRLLADLITLVSGSAAGNMVITLGNDVFGVWGVFHALQTIANTEIISNPFLVATNKKQAYVSVGETRRVVSGQVVSGENVTNSFTNKDALLKLTVTPQINSDGMIVLDLEVTLDVFVGPNNPTDVVISTKTIKTTTVVADNEVLALGGLVRSTNSDSGNKYPILSNIPLFGWLFKNYRKIKNQDNLLVLISSHIIRPDLEADTLKFTQRRVNTYQDSLEEMKNINDQRDPIHRFFFTEREDSASKAVENFIFSKKTRIQTRKTRRQQRKKKKADQSAVNTVIAQKNEIQQDVQSVAKALEPSTQVKGNQSTLTAVEIKHKKPTLTEHFSNAPKGETT